MYCFACPSYATPSTPYRTYSLPARWCTGEQITGTSLRVPSHSSRSRFRCRINACDDANSSYYEPWLNFTIPQHNGVWDQCEHFQANSETDASCEASAFNRSRSERCEAGFVFRDIENTISTEVSSYFVCINPL